MSPNLKKHLTRRNAIIAAGGVGAAAAATTLMSGGGGKSTLVGKIDPEKITALEDGFYLADGWVLSADDLKGVDLSKIKNAEKP